MAVEGCPGVARGRYRPLGLQLARLARRAGTSSGWWGLVVWLISRSVMACVFINLGVSLRDDVVYYFTSVQGSSLGPTGAVLAEYPVPIVWFIQSLAWIAGPSADVFVFVFAATMGIIDAGCCWCLWRCSRRAFALWLAFTVALGPLVWFRIDLVPAVCVLVALAICARRPALSGAAIALGAATKLWPALLIVPLLGATSSARRRVLGFGGCGLIIGLSVLTSQGFARSISPLAWQSARGLQIESIWATVPMMMRLFDTQDTWAVRVSGFHSYEISGPQIARWLQISSLATIVLLVLVVILGWLTAFGGMGLPGHRLTTARSDARAAVRHDALLFGVFSTIACVIVANKAFSPQYMLWLAGPVVMLVVTPPSPSRRPAAGRLIAVSLLCAGLTQLEFPLNYNALVADRPGTMVTIVLVARNLLVVGLTVYSSAVALRAAWAVGHDSDPDAGRGPLSGLSWPQLSGTGALGGERSTPLVAVPRVVMPRVAAPRLSAPLVNTPLVNTPDVSRSLITARTAIGQFITMLCLDSYALRRSLLPRRRSTTPHVSSPGLIPDVLTPPSSTPHGVTTSALDHLRATLAGLPPCRPARHPLETP